MLKQSQGIHSYLRIKKTFKNNNDTAKKNTSLTHSINKTVKPLPYKFL